MKKLIAILLVALMAMSLVACGNNGGEAGEATYAIVCKDASNPYMLRMISGFEAACEALGVKSVTKSPESATVDGQITIVNELVAQGVKGIAIAANDAAALEAMVREKHPVKEVVTGYVGPVIGAHTGPGVLVLFFMGSKR
jgi:rhamnose transport system substrate-binding protein